NAAPALAPVGQRTVELGGTLTFKAAGSDADVPVQVLRYGLAGAVPAGATINADTGAFAWTPAGPQVGRSFAFEVTVTDGLSSASTGVTVRAFDTTRPVISSVTASPDVLWPPLHLPIPVRVTVSASDAAGAPSCRITSVTNDETGTRDAFVIAPLWVFLVAERSAKGDGRVYTITVTCTDPSGNAATGRTTVLVPHDRRGGH
ncbi:MAG TPA: putative Ig domain-containing protein, partial [Streptomyces sp.]|nr:putative Ig domain-containing protein [Streptomyces sp.]